MSTTARTQPARAAAAAAAPGPTEAEIRHAAHQLWLEQGRPEGRELDHWFAAKETLRHHHGRSAGRGRKPAAAPVHFPKADLPAGPTTPTEHP
jgi:hypothetical protein